MLDQPTLAELRAAHLAEMECLPPALRQIDQDARYRVTLSDTLRRRQEGAIAAVRAREGL